MDEDMWIEPDYVIKRSLDLGEILCLIDYDWYNEKYGTDFDDVRLFLRSSGKGSLVLYRGEIIDDVISDYDWSILSHVIGLREPEYKIQPTDTFLI